MKTLLINLGVIWEGIHYTLHDNENKRNVQNNKQL